MKIHKEGHKMLIVLALLLMTSNGLLYWFSSIWIMPFVVLSAIVFLAVLQFFRSPTRKIPIVDNQLVYAPADGKIVVIEKTTEEEYFKDHRIQISIFMSPVNVHINRNPVGGKVNYFQYHPGKYLVAWHPKSSTENERTTIVIGNYHAEVLVRQIAGAVARRIINYLNTGDQVKQGDEMGFIKFGSRVDVFLPLDAKIEVELNQKVKGNRTVIARI